MACWKLGRFKGSRPRFQYAMRGAPLPARRRVRLDRSMTHRSPPRALLLALAGLALTGCGGQQAKPRNVLLVSIDTLRADRHGCQGRADAGTPVMDALAARGARLADANSPYPLTLPLHATLLTGRLSLRHGLRDNAMFALGDAETTLAERLSAKGLRAGAFVGSVVLARRCTCCPSGADGRSTLMRSSGSMGSGRSASSRGQRNCSKTAVPSLV